MSLQTSHPHMGVDNTVDIVVKDESANHTHWLSRRFIFNAIFSVNDKTSYFFHRNINVNFMQKIFIYMHKCLYFHSTPCRCKKNHITRNTERL